MPFVWLKPTYTAGTLAGGAVPSEGIPGNHWGADNSQYDTPLGQQPLYVPIGHYYSYQWLDPNYGEYRGIEGAPLSGTWPPPQDLTGIYNYGLQQRNWSPYWQYPQRVGNTPPNNKRAQWIYFDWDQNPDAALITSITDVRIYWIQRRAYEDGVSRPVAVRTSIYEHTSDFPNIPGNNPSSGRFENIDYQYGAGILPRSLANSKFYASYPDPSVFTVEPTGGSFNYSKRYRYWVYFAYLDGPGPGWDQDMHQIGKVWLAVNATLGGTPPPGTGGNYSISGYSG